MSESYCIHKVGVEGIKIDGFDRSCDECKFVK